MLVVLAGRVEVRVVARHGKAWPMVTTEERDQPQGTVLARPSTEQLTMAYSVPRPRSKARRTGVYA
jgi:hypothetical protein